MSREQRTLVEEELKAGLLPCVVATSSLELGIDMGAVDLVVQVEAPPSVASGLQRVGRAGHQVGAVSAGVVFPKYRGDLVSCAVVAERMTAGQIESMRYPRNPLDVLAQQIVAMVALEPWTLTDLARVVRRAAPFAALPDSALHSVLDMLAGRYPSEEFGELRARITWDRVTDELRGRPGAQRLAVTSGGTIPDRGLFTVMTPGGADGAGSRVGELDEEMVYESRVGDTFLLGTSSWRVEDITHDRVIVTPAPGRPARMPFWKGESIGRPLELGRAVGAFVREMSGAGRRARPGSGPPRPGWTRGPPTTCSPTCASSARRPGTCRATARSWSSGSATSSATGGWSCTPRSVRRSTGRGRWRSRPGCGSGAGWRCSASARRRRDRAAAAGRGGRLRRRGRAHRGGRAAGPGRGRADRGRRAGLRRRCSRPGSGSARRGRCCCPAATRSGAARCGSSGRSPRSCWRWPGEYEQFPITLEAMRECVQDVYDLPGLRELMTDVAARKVQVVEVATPSPSPFARSLLFGYVGMFLYEADAPLAERRAAALSLDSHAARRAARAPRRSGSCSTPRCSPRSRRRCSGWRRTGTRATRRAPPTCCGSSAT